LPDKQMVPLRRYLANTTDKSTALAEVYALRVSF